MKNTGSLFWWSFASFYIILRHRPSGFASFCVVVRHLSSRFASCCVVLHHFVSRCVFLRNFASSIFKICVILHHVVSFWVIVTQNCLRKPDIRNCTRNQNPFQFSFCKVSFWIIVIHSKLSQKTRYQKLSQRSKLTQNWCEDMNSGHKQWTLMQ